jgi:long-chain acyl-CoA synthetase
MLVEKLLEQCRRLGPKPAVDDGIRTLTFAQLALLSRVMRDIVERESRCERIGVMLPASGAFPAALFGSLWAGRVVVPLNLLLSADELAGVVADAGLDVFFTVRPLESLASKLPARAIFLEDLPLKTRLILAMFRRWPGLPRPSPHDTAVILYTSGTTARPKGVELSFSNLFSNATDSVAALHLDASHRFLNILPPFHVFGLTAGVLIPLFLGLTTVAMPRFNPLAMIRAIESQGITATMAIPSMYAALLKSKSARREQFKSLRIAVSGGEPLPDAVRTAFQERFGVTLLEGYGLTETSPVISVCTPDANKPGTVGRPIPNVEVRIVGADGQSLPPGQEGEIRVRGPGVMKGYYRLPEETRKVIDGHGWFITGDIGRFDREGFLSITGRVKDMLIIGGENVAAREIEAALEAHPGVAQAAVIGVADELRGEQAVGFVVPREGLDVSETDLRTFVKQSLAGFKVPKRIVIRTELPTGPTGKILKRKLKELL